ncbi:MAG: PEP-CTERM system histidine kinase PrsK, partial [Acetobacteraceae bacterium]|nr:PEP-CTERM system histidine kinase PrsK [Acetobacteraceae bacterium]
MQLEPSLFVICSAAYATLAVLIAIQARQSTNLLLAGACVITAAWAGTAAIWPEGNLDGITGVVDLVRAVAWYGFILHLYVRSAVGPRLQVRAFSAVGGGAAALAVLLAVQAYLGQVHGFSVVSLPIALRLALAVCELLLIENLYLNLPEHARWHVAVPCVLLGGLACFDILLCADLVLFKRASPALAASRAVAMMIVAPLLVIAASRGQRWEGQIRLSRAAVFHSATLVLSGAVLLSLALAGEVLRQLGADWGWVAEVSLVFAGLIGLGLLISSRSARSVLQRTVVQHFFAD